MGPMYTQIPYISSKSNSNSKKCNNCYEADEVIFKNSCSPDKVVSKALGCDVIIKEFEPPWCHCDYFMDNTHGNVFCPLLG